MAKQEGKPDSAGKNEKKPGSTPAPVTSSTTSSSGAQRNVSAKVGCLAVECKQKDTRASFCEEHFKQFKFGLITKTGSPVLDYDKKFEHYQKWLRAQKAA